MNRNGVLNVSRQQQLGSRIWLAEGWWSRLRGLLGRPPLRPGEGMLLRPCRAVHMYGMRHALDVAFLDPSGRVVALYHRLRPGKRTRWHREAAGALELPPGVLALTETELGDLVELTPAGAPDGASRAPVSAREGM